MVVVVLIATILKSWFVWMDFHILWNSMRGLIQWIVVSLCHGFESTWKYIPGARRPVCWEILLLKSQPGLEMTVSVRPRIESCAIINHLHIGKVWLEWNRSIVKFYFFCLSTVFNIIFFSVGTLSPMYMIKFCSLIIFRNSHPSELVGVTMLTFIYPEYSAVSQSTSAMTPLFFWVVWQRFSDPLHVLLSIF